MVLYYTFNNSWCFYLTLQKHIVDLTFDNYESNKMYLTSGTIFPKLKLVYACHPKQEIYIARSVHIKSE